MKKKYEPRTLKFNQNANSNDFNEMNKELGHDFYEIYRNISQQKTMLDEVIRTLKLNNYNLYSKINQFHYEDDGISYISLYDKDNISFGEDMPVEELDNKCFYDFNYGIATLNILSRNTKTHLITIDGKPFVPDDLNITVTDNVEGAEIFETDIRNAFDQKLHTSWLKEYKLSSISNVNEIVARININIPRSIITDMFVNSIYLDMLPERTVNIRNIEYKPLNSSGYESIEGFETITSAAPMLISFPAKQITDIKITLSQDKDFSGGVNDYKIFPIGIKNCIVSHDFYDDESEVYLKFNPGRALSRIKKINLDFLREVPEKSYEVSIYGVNLNDGQTLKEIGLEEAISLNYNENFYIKVTLFNNFKPTPVLKGAEIKYNVI